MNIESVRTYCLSKKLATEDCAFGPDWILFRVYNKIFACLDLTRPDRVILKCDAAYGQSLRDTYNGVIPAWHWNKRYWNEVLFNTDVDDALIFQLIDHSLNEVLAHMPRKYQQSYFAG